MKQQFLIEILSSTLRGGEQIAYLLERSKIEKAEEGGMNIRVCK